MNKQVELIKAEVERLKANRSIGLSEYDMGRENGEWEVCVKLLNFINSLPKKPSKVWHDANEESPMLHKPFAVIEGNGDLTASYTLVSGGMTWDRIKEVDGITKWAYTDDTLNIKEGPRFKVGDMIISTKNPSLTYKVLRVGLPNELGKLDYEVEIFTDSKAGIKVGNTFEEHNIHLISCDKMDEWGKLLQEPVSEDLGEYINELSKQFPEVSFAKLSRIAVRVANWQKEQFEQNRLAACDRLTKEEAEREQDFCMSIIKNEHRAPTFDDAIKYGMKLKEQQMMEKTMHVDDNTEWDDIDTFVRHNVDGKSKIIIIKEQ